MKLDKLEITRKDVIKNNYLDIRLDTVFKGVFLSEMAESNEALKSIIEAHIGTKVKQVFPDKNEPAPINVKEKQIRFDINATLGDGQKVIIEMSYTKRKDELIRSEYYLAKRFSSQDTKGIEDYNEINDSYLINIIDEGYSIPNNSLYNYFIYFNPEKMVSLGGKTKIITIELDKLKLLNKTVTEMDSKERWAFYIKYVNDETKKEEIKEILKLEGGINMANIALKRMSEDESAVCAAISAQKQRDDWRTQRNLDRAEGKVEGIEIGVAKGREEMAVEKSIEIAKNSLKKGLDLNTISEITGLDTKVIESIKEDF